MKDMFKNCVSLSADAYIAATNNVKADFIMGTVNLTYYKIEKDKQPLGLFSDHDHNIPVDYIVILAGQAKSQIAQYYQNKWGEYNYEWKEFTPFQDYQLIEAMYADFPKRPFDKPND